MFIKNIIKYLPKISAVFLVQSAVYFTAKVNIFLETQKIVRAFSAAKEEEAPSIMSHLRLVPPFILFLICKALYPFEGITFFKKHLQLLRLIKTESKHRFLFRAFLIFLILKSAHFLLFFLSSPSFTSTLPPPFSSPSMSTFTRVLHYDAVTLTFGRSALNVNAFAVIASGVYMYLFFFIRHPPNLNNHLLWEITGERDDSFFIAQKHRSVLVVDFIRSRLLLIFNGVESAAISTNLLTVGIHFRLGMMLIEEIRGLSFVEQLFYHLIFTLAGALFLFSILTHLYILSLVISLGASQLLVLSIKLLQLSQYCSNCTNFTGSFSSSKKGLNKKNLNRFCFTFYHRHLVSIFGYFREYNVVYGRLFVVFIFVNAVI